MYDYGQMISQLHLIGLLPQTQLRLRLHLPKPDKPLPQSPYWDSSDAKLVVTIPFTADVRATTRKLAAVLVTLKRLGADTTLSGQPFALAWVLPEQLIATSYDAIANTAAAPTYAAFQSGWYLRVLQVWPKLQPQLQAAFGVHSGFNARVLGDANSAQGLVGVEWQQVPLLANTDTGSQTSSLLWLRAVLWGLLNNQLIDGLADWGQATILDQETVQVLRRFQPGARHQVPNFDDGVHLAGYPQLALDNQLKLAAALASGCAITVLDERAEVLQIDSAVIAGAATLNSQAAALAANAKPAQKALLGAAGLPVPAAAEYVNRQTALHDYATSYQDKAIVVKPSCGHDGLGVHVFMMPPTQAAFLAAYDAAAAYGSVLVEAYAKGAAYRLFVQDGQVQAALELTPANVVGDGRRTIAALVSHKNAKRPVGWQPVVLDDQATQVLAMQGFSGDSILPRGHQAFLRFASNTRFGADGYDVTDDLATGYAKLAVKAAQTLNLAVCGVDMMIPNLYQAYDPSKPGMAAILSVTATPALWPHAVAQMGTKRDLAPQLVAAVLAVSRAAR